MEPFHLFVFSCFALVSNRRASCVSCVPAYQMLAALYQNFVVNGFSVEGDQLKRYEAGQSKLAGILGLDPAAKMKVW